MIVSGWILPNSEEILCGYKSSKNNYGSKLHLEVIRDYINTIKHTDYSLYLKISKSFEICSFSDNYIDYEKLAVFVLAWIKVGIIDRYKYIISINMSFQKPIISKYASLGYNDQSSFLDITDYNDVILIF